MHLKKRSFKCKNDQLVYMYDEFVSHRRKPTVETRPTVGFRRWLFLYTVRILLLTLIALYHWH